MDELTERRNEITKKIAAEREALHKAFMVLEPPLRRVEKGIRVVGSVRHYWKTISLALSIFSALMLIRRLFTPAKKKVARQVQADPFPEKQKGLFLWIGRAWRAYRWYLKIRTWLA